MALTRLIVCGVVLLTAACGTRGAATPLPAYDAAQPEARSLGGQPLHRPVLAADTRARLERDLAGARAAYEQAPHDADSIIWLGRRLAYLGQYRAAIDVFSDGIAKRPRDARMYRHRGHRYITTRQLDRAIADLEHAAELIRGTADEIEPDGAPNRFNIPTSTLHTNIWYHLALAYYLKHEFGRALPVWRRAVDASTNADMLVASADWLYMTLRRLGRAEEAARVLDRITPDMRILENDAYHRRLLMYKGLLPPDSLLGTQTTDPVQLATYGYGIANWHLYNGRRDTAYALFSSIVTGSNWAAFGFIAAEAELAASPR